MPVRLFPFRAVRDLIGVLRATYAYEAGDRLGRKERLVRIKKLADELHRAVAMAAGHDPGTAPYEKAVGLADAVCGRLGEIYETDFGMMNEGPAFSRSSAQDQQIPWMK